ncbi:hypothetical protein QE152_g13379 [Popillia japonica]|uniref:Nucleic-acid-binding protein from transposon X-element n=1 Tax=Popillia japonica TaxID=7064 RepID=A0AAW1LD57_POPJA
MSMQSHSIWDSLYNLTEVLSLEISVETLKSRPTVGQCFRCQRFGHAQSRCTAPKKCVACAGDHASESCPRPKKDPATCANCGEEHPANYRGCLLPPQATANHRAADYILRPSQARHVTLLGQRPPGHPRSSSVRNLALCRQLGEPDRPLAPLKTLRPISL